VAAFALFAVAMLAPAFAPAPADVGEDVAGARFLPPLTRADAIRFAGEPGRVLIVTSLRREGAGWRFTRAGSPREAAAGEMVGEPSPRFYLAGTDSLGRDLAIRLLFAARRSLAVALVAVALALLLGVAIGSAAGIAGGWGDAILMRGVDVVMSIPRLLLYLLCAALLRPSTEMLIVVLGATTWTGMARIVRAKVMSLREGDLCLAARSLGATPRRVLFRHLLPQIGPLLAVSAALRLADTILLESALGFLGLSAPPPAVSLGDIIASGRDALANAWWIAFAPGLVIALLVLATRASVAATLRLDEPSSSV